MPRHNRNLAEGGKLWDKVKAVEVLGEIAFVLPGRAGKNACEVKQELRASHVQLPGKIRIGLSLRRRVRATGCCCGPGAAVPIPNHGASPAVN